MKKIAIAIIILGLCGCGGSKKDNRADAEKFEDDCYSYQSYEGTLTLTNDDITCPQNMVMLDDTFWDMCGDLVSDIVPSYNLEDCSVESYFQMCKMTSYQDKVIVEQDSLLSNSCTWEGKVNNEMF